MHSTTGSNPTPEGRAGFRSGVGSGMCGGGSAGARVEFGHGSAATIGDLLKRHQHNPSVVTTSATGRAEGGASVGGDGGGASLLPLDFNHGFRFGCEFVWVCVGV